MRRLSVAICLMLLLATMTRVFGYAAVVNKEDYHEAHVVPAPRGVKIDGNLNDWDRSAEMFMFADPAMAKIYSVRGYMMYDDEALYLAAHVKDPTPMMNQYAAGSDYAMSWNADAVQIRLITDPTIPKPYPTGDQRGHGAKTWETGLAHMTLWYSTLEKKPCFFVCFGMRFADGQLNPKGVRAAYRKDEDGAGYRFEYRIPWAVLKAEKQHPGAGDVTGTQWQMHWGDREGKQLARGLTDVRMRGAKMLGYMAPGEYGKAIFTREGDLDLPRRRIDTGGAPEGHIPVEVTVPGPEGRIRKLSLAIWDGDGKLVRTLCGALPVKAGKVTVMWDGLDDFQRPLPPGEYQVKGLRHNGIETAFVAAVNNSGRPPWQTNDGTGSWGGDYGPPVSATTAGERVYVVWPGGEAMVTHIALDLRGRKQWGAFGNHSLRHSIAWTFHDGALYQLGVAGLLKMDADSGRHIPFSGGKSAIKPFPQSWSRHAIVAQGDALYVTQSTKWDKKSTNAVLVLDIKSGDVRKEIAVDFEPWGIAVSPGGQFYLSGAGAIRKFDPATGKTEGLIDELDDARSLCCDADGNIYVALQGRTHQVRKYSPAGKLLQAWGRKGGRSELGRYEAGALLNPQGIAVDRDGHLWICENDNFPRRLSVWNQDGTLWREFFGSAAYSPYAYADPKRPWLIEEASVRWKVNLKTGEAEPYATMLRGTPTPKEPNAWNRKLGWGHFIHRDGRIYLNSKGNGGYFKIFEEADGLYQLRLVQTKSGLFIDQNGDGRIQDNEMHKQPKIQGVYWSLQAGPNLDIYWPDPKGVYHWPLQRIAQNGCLEYTEKPRLIECRGWPPKVQNLAVGEDGAIYALSYGGDAIQRGEPMQGRGHFLGKWAPDGRLLWKYQNAWESFAWNSGIYQPGQLLAYVRFSGRPGRFVAVAGYYGQYFIIDAETGLFVTALGQDQRSNYNMDATMVHTENFNGFLYKPDGYENYHFLAGDADVRIWRLNGLGGIERFAETIRVEASQAKRSEDLLAKRRREHLRSMRKPADVYRVPDTLKIDGDPRDWRRLTYGRPGAKIHAPSGRGGQVWLMYDDKNLYALYEVQDDTPLINDPKDPNLLFKTGDALDLLLQTDPEADPQRKRPVAGDLRVVLTRTHRGEMIATLYRPVSNRRGFKAHFESPTGKEDYDEVRPITDIEMGFTKRKKKYYVELALPWKLLGRAAPTKGQTLRGDFGIIYGNPGGTRNAIKYMWADQSPEVSINNDIPSEVRLHPSEWGEIRFW